MATRYYNATIGSLGSRVRSTFESWFCYLCAFRQLTVPLRASLGSCVEQGKSSIYLTRSLPGLNEVINTKCLAQHLEHHLQSQKHYLLHHCVSPATPGTACFPALCEGGGTDSWKWKQLPCCVGGVNVCVTVFHFLLEPFPLWTKQGGTRRQRNNSGRAQSHSLKLFP